MITSKTSKLLLSSMLLLAFTACGGGGGGSSDDTTSSNNTSNTTSEGNQAPIADAGPDQKVYLNTSIIVVGTGSDSDGTIASYEWKKGSSVLANTATLTYDAIALGTETLTLTVMDDDGATDEDSFVIEVVEKTTVDPSELLP
ncbi:MAG: PKD domain-containing protein [Epsilonproteobacteria bacterium]|nr:PKD domain-containing protein [Campylobacterota bacterium]